MNKNLDFITHAVTLIIKAAIMAARFSGRVRKPPLSGAGKHHNFQVTSCHQNVSTDADFAYIESE